MQIPGLKVWNFVFISYFIHICAIPQLSGQVSTDIVPGAEKPAEYLDLLRGKHVAVAVNHSSLVGQRHLVDFLLLNAVDVVKIFAPEHGFRGTAANGELVSNAKDSLTGLPIISLYGNSKKLSAEQLKGVDIVVFDIQDVGVRFYTYISTLHYIMETCAKEKVPVIVLDRPNPNGFYVDGPVLKPGYESFIGMHHIPVVYGMTIGELALMINGEGWLDRGMHCDLRVIPCDKYDHHMTYAPPVAPSPNLPNLRSILLYPSLCFFEGTTVSVGRGTDEPFQVIGHPDFATGSYMFKPESKRGATHPKYEGEDVYGTNLSEIPVEELWSWHKINLNWLIGYYETLHDLGDVFFDRPAHFDKLAGSDALRLQIIDGLTENQIRASWREDILKFKEIRRKYLLYPDFE